MVWQSAFVLAEYLLRCPPFGQWDDVRVVDLGTGTGELTMQRHTVQVMHSCRARNSACAVRPAYYSLKMFASITLHASCISQVSYVLGTCLLYLCWWTAALHAFLWRCYCKHSCVLGLCCQPNSRHHSRQSDGQGSSFCTARAYCFP